MNERIQRPAQREQARRRRGTWVVTGVLLAAPAVGCAAVVIAILNAL